VSLEVRLLINNTVFLLLVKWRYTHSVVKLSLLFVIEGAMYGHAQYAESYKRRISFTSHSLKGRKFLLKCKTVAQIAKKIIHVLWKVEVRYCVKNVH